MSNSKLIKLFTDKTYIHINKRHTIYVIKESMKHVIIMEDNSGIIELDENLEFYNIDKFIIDNIFSLNKHFVIDNPIINDNNDKYGKCIINVYKCKKIGNIFPFKVVIYTMLGHRGKFVYISEDEYNHIKLQRVL